MNTKQTNSITLGTSSLSCLLTPKWWNPLLISAITLGTLSTLGILGTSYLNQK